MSSAKIKTQIVFSFNFLFDGFLLLPQLPSGFSHFLPEAANQLQPADQSQQPVQHSTGDRGDQSDQNAGLWERSAALPSDGASQRGAGQPQHGHRGWFFLWRRQTGVESSCTSASEDEFRFEVLSLHLLRKRRINCGGLSCEKTAFGLHRWEFWCQSCNKSKFTNFSLRHYNKKKCFI